MSKLVKIDNWNDIINNCIKISCSNPAIIKLSEEYIKAIEFNLINTSEKLLIDIQKKTLIIINRYPPSFKK